MRNLILLAGDFRHGFPVALSADQRKCVKTFTSEVSHVSSRLLLYIYIFDFHFICMNAKKVIHRDSLICSSWKSNYQRQNDATNQI